ncbi:MAG: hypothetical protein HW389_987 [Bacteroidetes bacterium]|nr:hypothetical protein [Bacteroidota bacterium]
MKGTTMKPYRHVLSALLWSVFLLTALILVSGTEAAAQGEWKSVASSFGE